MHTTETRKVDLGDTCLVYGERVRRVSRARHVEEPDVSALSKLLEEAAAAGDVGQPLDGRGVLRHEDGRLVVAPDANGLIAELVEGQEADHVVDENEHRSGRGRREELGSSGVDRRRVLPPRHSLDAAAREHDDVAKLRAVRRLVDGRVAVLI